MFIDKMRSPLLCMTWLSETGMRLGLRIWLIIKGDDEKQFQCLLLDVFVLQNSTEKKKISSRESFTYNQPLGRRWRWIARLRLDERPTELHRQSAILLGESLGHSDDSEYRSVRNLPHCRSPNLWYYILVIHFTLDLVSYVRYISRKRVDAGVYLHWI